MGAPNMAGRERPGLIEDAPSDFNVRWDGRGEKVSRTDHGSIGEDPEGIWARRHPEVLLLDECADLVEVFDEFSAGRVEVTDEDWETLAAPAYDAKMVLRDTLMRAQTK